jgi:HEPN domain-containing protein
MMRRVDHPEFRRWRDAADGARQAAELQAERPKLTNWACFLAEQAGQLAVKALLHGMGAGAWGHDLVELGGRIEEQIAESLPEPLAAALQRLSRHYIPARYPDAYPGGDPAAHYGPEDARRALADLEEVTQFVDAMWSQLVAAQESGPRDDGS